MLDWRGRQLKYKDGDLILKAIRTVTSALTLGCVVVRRRDVPLGKLTCELAIRTVNAALTLGCVVVRRRDVPLGKLTCELAIGTVTAAPTQGLSLIHI